VSGWRALADAKSGPDVNPTLRPDSRLAFRRPGRQTHGAHRTQGIIFADVCLSLHQNRNLLEVKKQSLVALSTPEAEYVPASEASQEAVWLRRILSEMHETFSTNKGSPSAAPPITLYIDNQAAIKLIKNPRFHECTKL